MITIIEHRLKLISELASLLYSRDPIFRFDTPEYWKSIKITPPDDKTSIFLFHLARIFQPKVMIELGVYKGASTCQLAKGNPNGHVYGIDKTMEKIPDVIFDIPNITIINKDSLKAYKDVPPADLIYFDSLHTYDHTKAEFEKYKTNPLAILVFDDIGPDSIDRDSMNKFWDEIDLPKIELPHIHGSHGFGVCINDRES